MSETIASSIEPKVRLVWHRRDLRLLDNPLYSELTNNSNNTSLLSVYVFDESFFAPRPSTCNPQKWDAVTNGPHASRLLIQAVRELRKSIREMGGELLVRVGDPATIVPQVARQISATEVWWAEEPGFYEEQVSRSVRDHFLAMNRIKIVQKVGYTLYHPNDLPWDPNEWAHLAHPKQNKKKKGYSPTTTNRFQSEIDRVKAHHDLVDVSVDRFKGMSRIMGDFCKAARASASVRSTLPSPTCLQQPPNSKGIEAGDIPSLELLVAPLLRQPHRRPILGLKSELIELAVSSALSRNMANSQEINGNDDSCDVTAGGESWALKRLHHFVNDGHAATADRSLADVSGNNSSKLAVHLALGTLSPRTVYETAKEAGEECHWLLSHLEMRDFFLFLAFASGSQLFRQKGMPVAKKHVPPQWHNPAGDKMKDRQWEKWAAGETGLPLVDAAMTELTTTGYCSNRVRQNLVSVLSKDLEIDWRAGAEWFQFLLEDHCVGANWGNWLYFSGVGPDPKNRHFRTVSQAMRYDPDGTYVKKWLPKLNRVADKEALFRPWDFIADWNDPLVAPKTQLTWQDLQRLEQTGKLSPQS
jgi:deoxyribodipyrimidine photo-lyase